MVQKKIADVSKPVQRAALNTASNIADVSKPVQRAAQTTALQIAAEVREVGEASNSHNTDTQEQIE